MFAFTLFDLKEMKIVLIKDIFGMKPLYYFLNENSFIFSSEIEPILKIIKKTKINSQKAYDYISYSLHDNDKNTFFDRSLLAVDLEDHLFSNPKRVAG